MMTLNHVTFTGLDAQTDLERVAELSARYPIEWGVLHSSTSKSQRYPRGMDLEQIEDFGADRGLMLAAHVCGQVSQEFQSRDGWDVVNPYIYGRVQVNSRSYENTMENLKRYVKMFGKGGRALSYSIAMAFFQMIQILISCWIDLAGEARWRPIFPAHIPELFVGTPEASAQKTCRRS